MARHRKANQDTRSKRRAAAWLCCAALAGVVIVLDAGQAHAQEQNLGEATAQALAIGDATGCVEFLDLPPDTDTGDPAVEAQARDYFATKKLGEQIAGICLNSAVGAGPSFGVSMGLRPTRSVTQYRLASSRLDRRLNRRRGVRGDIDHPIQLASIGPVMIGDVGSRRWSLFGAVDYEQRDQAQSHLDPGYSADLMEIDFGADMTLNPSVALGVMLDYVDRSGDFDRAGLITRGEGPNDSQTNYTGTDLQTDAQVQDVCGLIPGGDFDQKGFGLSVFGGYEGASGWYARAVAGYAQRDYDYTRRVCALETATAASVTDANNNDRLTPDRYAGSIRGSTEAREMSFDLRAGKTFALGAWILRPEGALTALKVRLDGYQESGVASVTAALCTGSNDPVGEFCSPGRRAFVIVAGKTPTGLEIRTRDQDTDSVQTSLGFSVGRPFVGDGFTLVPRIGATYVHEFADDAFDVSFQFAQDLRGASAKTYSYRTGDPDRDFGWINAGLSLVAANGAEFDVEARALVGDERYDAWTLHALARVRF